jgi:hypothetical protein
MDNMHITILPGSLVKVETDRISAPNHLSADRLIRGLEEDLGGTPRIERKHADLVTDHDKHREADLA